MKISSKIIYNYPKKCNKS